MTTIHKNYRRKRLVKGIVSAVALSVSVSLQAEVDQLELNLDGNYANVVLLELAEKAGAQIIVPEEVGKRVWLSGLKGEYRLSEALDAILKGTNLTYEFTSEDTILVTESEAGTEGSSAPDNGVDEEVVVTGTRLKNVSSGSHTQVITRDDIKQRGFGSVEDIIRSLPQNLGSVNSSFATGSSVEEVGASAANLRGIGSGSTLILVNGRRWAQSPMFRGDGTVNLNGIPFSAIDSVEILLDGASAVYGADAQAGVINFILRDDYVGAETTARYESGRFGGDRYRLEQTLGFNWDSGSALLNLSHADIEGASRRKAGLTTVDFTNLGGRDNRIPSFGQPGAVPTLLRFGPFTFPVPPYRSLPQDDDGTNGLAGLSVDNAVPYDSAAASDLDSTTVSDTTSISLHIDQAVSETVEVYADVLYTRNDVVSAGGIFFLTPFSTIVPTTNIYNDTADAVNVGYAFAAETNAGLMPTTEIFNNTETSNYTFGVKAQLPFKDWSGEFSVSRAEDKAITARTGFDSAVLRDRILGFNDANDNGVQDAGEAAIPDEQMLNLFGNGAAQNPAALDGLIVLGGLFFGTTEPNQENESRLDTYDLSFQGGLFDLPAGEVQMAIGGEYRTSELTSFTAAIGGVVPGRDVTSYFTEFGVPLVGDSNNLPGVYQLDLKIAARHDKYEFEGPFDDPGFVVFSAREFTKTTPKVDLNWYPVEEFRVRATWGESFRAPSLDTLFAEQFTSLAFNRPLTDPENPDVVTDQYLVRLGGNPSVLPELSDNLSIGFDWAPGGVLDGLSASVTWSDIEFTDQITRLSTGSLNERNLLVLLGRVKRDNPTDNLITELDGRALNLALSELETVDFNINYDFDTEIGAFNVGLNGTYTSRLQDTAIPGEEPIDRDGFDSGPERMKATGLVGWSGDNMTANVVVNYSSSYTQLDTPDPRRIGHYITYDLTGSYTLDDSGWKFNAGILNVTNASFPFFDGRVISWDPVRVNPRGRIIYMEASKEFELF